MANVKIHPAALTEIRERSGYSKAALCSLAGIAPSYLTEMEKGDKPGSATVIRKLADALKCPVAAIILDPAAAAGPDKAA